MKLSPLTRAYIRDRGWHVLSLHQRPQDDGRRLKRCPIPSDPWFASVGDAPSYLEAAHIRCGEGATADDAALSALPPPGDLKSAFGRLATAMNDLAEEYRR